MAIDDRIATLTVAPGVQRSPIDFSKPSGVNLKGFSLEALCAVVSDRFGPELVETWKQRAKVDLRTVTATAWFPIEYYYHLIEHCVTERLSGSTRAAAELGATTAKREINAFFRFVLAFTTPSMVIGLSARFWRQYYDKSELTIVEAKSNSLRAEVRDWPLMNESCAYELAGSPLTWMEASRAKAMRITALEFSAPGVLRIDASW